MAVLNQGILGGGRNKVGPVVMTSWKGRAVVKAMPLSVANPRTTPQVNQRNKFKSASQFSSLILGQWIKPLWDRFSGNITGNNAWSKANIGTFSDNGDMNPDMLVMSRGKMMVPTITSVLADVSLGTVAVGVTIPNDTTWGQASESGYLLARNQTTGLIQVIVDNVGNDTTVTITADALDFEVGDVIDVWVAIRRGDGTQVSPSQYDSTIAVA